MLIMSTALTWVPLVVSFINSKLLLLRAYIAKIVIIGHILRTMVTELGKIATLWIAWGQSWRLIYRVQSRVVGILALLLLVIVQFLLYRIRHLFVFFLNCLYFHVYSCNEFA